MWRSSYYSSMLIGNGSDAGAASTTAVLCDDQYLINGSKCWVTNGFEAEAGIVFATTDKMKKHKGISAFIVHKPCHGKKTLFL